MPTIILRIDKINIVMWACLKFKIPFFSVGAPIDLKFIPKKPTINPNGKNIVVINVISWFLR